MKRSIYIITTVLLALLSSCSDEDMPGKEHDSLEKKTQTLKFSLSIDGGDGFAVSTRASSNPNIQPIPSDYTVYVYWFQRNQDDGEDYYIGMESVEGGSVYTKEVTIGEKYSYVFLAVPKNYGNVISPDNIRDFGQANVSDFSSNSGNLGETSKLKNCFLPFFADDENEASNSTKQGFSVTRNLQVFGDGNKITAGYELHAPANIVLRRQFGAIEIKGTESLKGKSVKCVVKSDYYRLYLSQMIKPENSVSLTEDEYYNSENEAQDAVSTIDPCGDYFSSTYFTDIIPSFTFEEENVDDSFLTEEGNLLIYLPYTAAYTKGTVKEEHKTLYGYAVVESEGPSLTFSINGQEYKYEKPFPIRRNTKSYFSIEGTELHFSGQGGEGGIDLDDDEWDGVVTNQ